MTRDPLQAARLGRPSPRRTKLSAFQNGEKLTHHPSTSEPLAPGGETCRWLRVGCVGPGAAAAACESDLLWIRRDGIGGPDRSSTSRTSVRCSREPDFRVDKAAAAAGRQGRSLCSAHSCTNPGLFPSNLIVPCPVDHRCCVCGVFNSPCGSSRSQPARPASAISGCSHRRPRACWPRRQASWVDVGKRGCHRWLDLSVFFGAAVSLHERIGRREMGKISPQG